MAEEKYENTGNQQSLLSGKSSGEQLDAAGGALSEALRISFVILKIIMIVLIVAFLASGFKTVGSDEKALVLRFGRIRGVGEGRLLGPGPHWVFPYPIEEIIKIPVGKKPNLSVDSFWYYQSPDEILAEGSNSRPYIGPTLNPVRDGYCITRGEKQSGAVVGSTGSDYNIVHCKWQLTYQIDDLERFFRNIYVEDTRPGEIYFDVITRNITSFLKDLVDSAVVTAMVNYTIDEAILSQDRIPKHVKKLLSEKLDRIESGISVVSIQLTDITWPRQVDYAFLASIRASQAKQKAIKEAETYAETTLNEAAGPVAAGLLEAIEDKTVDEQQKELLWAQLAGQAQGKIAQARAYRTSIVETAKADAEYMQRILPEYRKYPKLVVQKIYQDAIEYVFDGVDEKMIIQPAKGAKGRELRILVNRDPAIKPESEKK